MENDKMVNCELVMNNEETKIVNSQLTIKEKLFYQNSECLFKPILPGY